MAEPIEIQTPFIKLEQLLKLAGAFPTGGGCKEAIQSGQVQVNGAVCLLRGKKLHPGDQVTCGGHIWQVITP
ncbi:RNA-binding S4 domain-containing protein [Ethanoligenens harbinense]|uniref:RNA-binding S4 domain protein n=1 Tax=Ethanoligenens harbinense (strain DSM 18485 / JCM 12961 / CGMCC 1.5033 / YUAN-3) TaxID=663278 RepID=E6U5C7_ETHHY|nr:RNA-binding S4 domain-containing protein [Ethanoligenens harbinense]ADU25594.1 RNA-binding S4 domain protein [Ethanoligenens harbinense YUAN-3]AVQ94773.1 RNA-binding S4 domain-containing protein [Ethanoligenens harbinense YUAN-3]AYF37465.1 RNA-binding S4 domain-containing protein [Ethanoligenens harbinense]AYF40185.1 RNA-binding S4 domain-containing protein [Ethanoligenens harbinense]QCN91018.1 RNA-binding S4 domain-containing protein [Ethanoligenens harbinense]